MTKREVFNIDNFFLNSFDPQLVESMHTGLMDIEDCTYHRSKIYGSKIMCTVNFKVNLSTVVLY
jgi:hypothetical protein